MDLRGDNKTKYKPMKGVTSKKSVVGANITWKHRLIFQLPDYAKELRILVVRDRPAPTN